MENLANFKAVTTLASGLTDIAVNAIVASGSEFPAVNFRVRIDDELILVTNDGAGLRTNWTITRGIEGTTAAAHLSGAAVTHVLTAGAMIELFAQAQQIRLVTTAQFNAIKAAAVTTPPTGADTLIQYKISDVSPSVIYYWSGSAYITGGSSTAARSQKSTGFYRPFGIGDNIAVQGADTGQHWKGKVQVAAPAKRVRFRLRNAGQVCYYRGVRISVAPTEKAAIDTTANAYGVWQGGTTHNVVKSDTEPYGFTEVGWDGVVSTAGSRPVPLLNGILPGIGPQCSAGHLWSDWAEIPALESTDAPGKYFYIIAFERAALVGDAMPTIDTGTNKGIPMMYADYLANDAGARLFIGNNAATPVSTPANLGSSVTTSFVPDFEMEWDYGVPVKSYMQPGDSITENFRWSRKTIMALSTPAAPWEYANYGCSSGREDNWSQEMYLALQDGIRPTYMGVQTTSVNNFSPLSTFKLPQAQQQLARLMEKCNLLISLNIIPVIWECYNFFPYSYDVTVPIGYLHFHARAFATQIGAIYIATTADPRTNNTTYNATTNPTGFTSDGTHPAQQTGQVVLQELFTLGLLRGY